MPTSVHIPKLLLAAVDQRARRLKISRNKLIVQAIEREISNQAAWSPGFLDELRRATPADRAVVTEMLDAIVSGRSSKKPPSL